MIILRVTVASLIDKKGLPSYKQLERDLRRIEAGPVEQDIKTNLATVRSRLVALGARTKTK